MQIAFTCFNCAVQIEADSELCGDQLDCPSCGTTILVPAIGLGPGARIGGFEIERRVGTGGMGEVFLARQVRMNREVALKVLPPAMTKNRELLERFIHEVHMAGKLEHPNIVTAFDAGEEDGYHYLAMSFVDGEDLADRLERELRLPEREVLSICYRVARALGYAWDNHKLLHRDIKPGNIMIDRSGEIKLMDMGIAKSLGEDSNNLTMVGLFVGTPYYMSPEQAMSVSDIDCRSDIYSLGATMYHLLTGCRVYDGPTSMAVLSKHLSEAVPEPRNRNATISEATNTLVVRMLAKNRDDRPQNWDALADDVRALLGTQFETAESSRPVLDLLGDDDATLIAVRPRELPTAPIALPQVAPPAAPESDDARPLTVAVPAPLDIARPVRRLIIGGVAAFIVLVLAFMAYVAYDQTQEALKDRRHEHELRTANQEREEREQIGDIDAAIGERITTAEVRETEKQRLKQLEDMLSFAHDYLRRNPHDYRGAIRHYRLVQEAGIGTRFQLAADEAIRKLESKAQDAPQQVLDELADRAEGLIAQHRYGDAADIYEQYEGPMAAETVNARNAEAHKLQQHAKSVRRMRGWLDEIVRRLLLDEFDEVERLLQSGLSSADFRSIAPTVKREMSLARDLMGWPRVVADSLIADAGQPVDLRFKAGGLRRMIVTGGNKSLGTVEARLGSRTINFTVSDLAPAEILHRIDVYAPAGTARNLMLSLALLRDGKPERLQSNDLKGSILGLALLASAQSRLLLGRWSSERFSGAGYIGKPQLVVLTVTSGDACELIVDNRKWRGRYHLHGGNIFLELETRTERWGLQLDGANLVINPKPDIIVEMRRK
jgi:hypothetical protein